VRVRENNVEKGPERSSRIVGGSQKKGLSGIEGVPMAKAAKTQSAQRGIKTKSIISVAKRRPLGKGKDCNFRRGENRKKTGGLEKKHGMVGKRIKHSKADKVVGIRIGKDHFIRSLQTSMWKKVLLWERGGKKQQSI